uniref:Uncharacterized protein n=1 Tax=Avena sativa TaxID=4498 RepID=A0ACD5UMU6_AVESA
MEKGGVSTMDASVQDVWDWEVLPDGHRSFYAESRAAPTSHGHSVPDQKTEEPILLPRPSEADECKDIGIDVAPAETQEGHTPMSSAPTVADLLVSDCDDVVDKFESSDDAKEVADDVKPVSVPEGTVAADVLPHELSGGEGEEEEEEETKKEKRARPECVVFSVGKLRVNGIGALCSFGVAAATVCVFLVGGKLQHQQKQQHQQNIQLQFLGDDKRIQQVVQQTSRLNQAVSSMMSVGASTGAKISFGGFYDGY